MIQNELLYVAQCLTLDDARRTAAMAILARSKGAL